MNFDMQDKYYMVCFTLSYLKGIDTGIQSAHAIHTLYNELEKDKDDLLSFTLGGQRPSLSNYHKKVAMLRAWNNNPTIIIKNGGNGQALSTLYENLTKIVSGLDLPFAFFREPDMVTSRQSPVLTAIAILVPAPIFECRDEDMVMDLFNEDESELWRILRNHHRAH